MLGLQASNLEQQERLFKNQIRLGLREILNQELTFYNDAFNNIASCASILAGFAFTGMMLSPYDERSGLWPSWASSLGSSGHGLHRGLEVAFNAMSAFTTCLCLLTVVYSNYLALFSTRLALRGGDSAVEAAVTQVRSEYKLVLHAMTLSVESFLFMLPLLAWYKMEAMDACLVSGCTLPCAAVTVALYRRAQDKFYLDKGERFAAARDSAARERRDGRARGWRGGAASLKPPAGFFSSSDAERHSHGRRLSSQGRPSSQTNWHRPALHQITREVDRNNAAAGSVPRETSPQRWHGGSHRSAPVAFRRSLSWDAAQRRMSAAACAEEEASPLCDSLTVALCAAQEPTAKERDRHRRGGGDSAGATSRGKRGWGFYLKRNK